jgi:hypothetical protein
VEVVLKTHSYKKHKQMKIATTKLPNEERRIVLLDDTKGFSRRANRGLFKKIITNQLTYGLKYVYDNYFSLNKEDYINGEIEFFRKNYDFPPQHPMRGVVYACHDFNPDFYVPLANFHEKSLELKMNDFFLLCESLGAKSCTVVYEEENDKVIMSNLDLKKIPTGKGEFSTNNSFNSNSNTTTTIDGQVNFTKATTLKDLDSSWLKSERTWKNMKDSRLKGNRGDTRVEFNYIDDMGVNGKLAATLDDLGYNLGGSFTEMKRMKYIYDIKFWDI